MRAKLVVTAVVAVFAGGMLMPLVSANGATVPTNQPVTVTNTPANPVPITGDVGIDPARNAVTLSGTPAVSISGTPSVSVSGTPSVSVSGTPSVSVSGTPSVSVTNFPSPPATQAVSGTVSVNSLPSVTGSVSVTNLPQTQQVSGNVTAAPTVPGNPVQYNVEVTGTQDVHFFNEANGVAPINGHIAVTSLVISNRSTSTTEFDLGAIDCSIVNGYGHTGIWILQPNQTLQLTFPTPLVYPPVGAAQNWCFNAEVAGVPGLILDATLVGYHL